MHVHHREMALARLQTVADMKSDQIGDWLRDRQADADFVRSSHYLVERYQSWHDSGDSESGELLKSRLELFCKDWRFTGVTLLDSAGRKVWSSEKAPLSIAPEFQNAARQTLAENKAWRSAAYRDTENIVHLDFAAPLAFIPQNPPLIILHIDLANWLFSTLKRWPIPNTSGEILLIRFDKEQTIYLSDLRESKDSPSTPGMPRFTKGLITAQIQTAKVLSDTLLEGLDYLGVPVIAVVKTVPGTDWFLVSKINQSELYADTMNDAIWIGSVGLLSLFMTATGFHLVRQHQQLILARAVQTSQAERLNALNLLAAIADGSNDAIFAKDVEGRYILFNKAACDFVAKSVHEVLGHDDRSLFPADQAEQLRAIDRQAMLGKSCLTQEEVLSTAKGERVFHATKGPLHNTEGDTVGLYGISRDITDIKQIEKSLRHSEERLQLILSVTKDGLWDWDLRKDLAYLSPSYYEITGYNADDITPNFEFFKRTVHPDDLPLVMDVLETHLKSSTPTSEFDYRLITQSGQCLWMRGRGQVVERDAEGIPLRMVGTITDVSKSKIIEESLRRQAEELAQRNEELERFNRATVGRELDMIELKKQVNDLSLKQGLEPPFDLRFLDGQ
jgi:PAS domain S-box-containing protein